MQRIHPEFAGEICGSLETGNIVRGTEEACDAVRYWMDTLTREIGPQSKAEMPFIIAAMKNIVAAYDKLAPGAENVADVLRKCMRMRMDVFLHGR